MTRWSEHPLGGLDWPAAVRVDSRFGKGHRAHIASVSPDGLTAHVFLEDVGEDHPIVRDMLADNPDFTYDQLELEDIVPIAQIRDEYGRQLPDPRPFIEQLARERRLRDPAYRERLRSLVPNRMKSDLDQLRRS